MPKFQKGIGDWTAYRRPDCTGVDLHFGRRNRWEQSYGEAMAEIIELAESELRKQNGQPYVMFIHGSSTSRRGKTTTRSQVRKFMRSSAATPLIERSLCVEHETIFRAKVRLSGIDVS
jgi:hypothetical protein